MALSFFVVATPFGPTQSREPDRTLKLFFGHTGETDKFTFKRNGRYDRKELDRINSFLRDWRQNEPTRMDPQLLDLVWEVYQESGSHEAIHVVSAYRSPTTNAMLRRRSSGVAKNSQHMRGKAMDFFLPDVPLAKLRALAMKKQGGGVGYYPSSGSPFVHMDTGSVRAWPRMSRQQLIALFPNGETLHLPADGKPLPGYERAVARLQTKPGSTTLAYLDTESAEEADTDRTGVSATERGGVKAWLKRVLPGGTADETETASSSPDNSAETASEPLVAAADDEDGPRRPRARPQSAVEMAAAEVPQPLPAVAPAVAASLAYAPPPRARPDAAFLAASLASGANTLPTGADAIAALAVRSEEPVRTPQAASNPVDLAFAVLDEGGVLPSEEDRAAIAAFAAMRAQSTGSSPTDDSASGEQAVASAEQPAGGAAGVVIAPDGVPSYGTDRDAMRNLIVTPATYDPQFAQLAMPVPSDASSAIYRAPEAAADVSYLKELPVEHFASADTEKEPEERGFFMRLFASLVE